MVVQGLVVAGLGLGLGSSDWGLGFQLMGFGACGVGPSGFFGGWGSLALVEHAGTWIG